MTTVLDRAGSRPQIHAFVVGVDRYPYCGPTTRHEGRFGSAARQIPDLTCAVPSAVTTANWLLDNLVGDDFRPLGSLELLVSAAGPILFPVDEDTTEVERATFGNVRRAFELWRRRCGSNPDNVALFFFFGHGCRIQADDVLLLEDVCDAEAGFFDNAVDFGATYRAMSACAAGIQCYFIDACRDVPDYLDDLELRPRSLMTPSLHQPPRDAPIIYSTSVGTEAYGVRDQPTPFAAAVLDTLGGLGARQDDDWVIDTRSLGAAIARVMEWNAWPKPVGQQPAFGGGYHGGVIRTFASAPRVPFRIECRPAEAMEFADLTLDGTVEKLHRAPRPEAWQDHATADSYTVAATFGGGDFDDAVNRRMLVPPNHRYSVPVVRR
jgi:hypothetical protein